MKYRKIDTETREILRTWFGKNWRYEYMMIDEEWCKHTVNLNPNSVNKERALLQFDAKEMVQEMIIAGADTKEIIKMCGVSQPTVSYHRGVLRRKGLIE